MRETTNGSANGALLQVKRLNAFYGESHVLHGIDIEVKRGELVTLLGRNGAGKTTTLRSIMGLITRKGSLRFDGKELCSLPPEACIARRSSAGSASVMTAGSPTTTCSSCSGAPG